MTYESGEKRQYTYKDAALKRQWVERRNGLKELHLFFFFFYLRESYKGLRHTTTP